MAKGERIRKLREQYKMTQDELAEKLKTTKQTIYKYETGVITNIPSDKIEELALLFNVEPSYLMGWENTTAFEHDTPTNLITPAAYPLPILGTICAGNGILCEESFEGYFFVDNTIRANYCLHVKGDSMVDAEIYDGDIVFIRKEYDYEDGKIYAVVVGAECNAVLKKLYRDNDKIILQPCNSNYKPVIVNPDDVFIVGECVGVYRAY